MKDPNPELISVQMHILSAKEMILVESEVALAIKGLNKRPKELICGSKTMKQLQRVHGLVMS